MGGSIGRQHPACVPSRHFTRTWRGPLPGRLDRSVDLGDPPDASSAAAAEASTARPSVRHQRARRARPPRRGLTPTGVRHDLPSCHARPSAYPALTIRVNEINAPTASATRWRRTEVCDAPAAAASNSHTLGAPVIQDWAPPNQEEALRRAQQHRQGEPFGHRHRHQRDRGQRPRNEPRQRRSPPGTTGVARGHVPDAASAPSPAPIELRR